jgi:hypothetical protein
MGIAEQIKLRLTLPSVARADSARRLLHSSVGDYTVGQLLSDFARVNPSYRPPVTTAEEVREIADNVIYEDLLRRHVEEQGIARQPAIAAQLADEEDFLDVQSFVRRSAYERVPTDSATLAGHYGRHPRWFDTWARAEIVRAIFPTRAQADSIARLMATRAQAESLKTKRMSSGLPYATYLAESADTALFARIQRAGTAHVVGPDETEDGWRVVRATRITPRQPRPFAQVRELVLRDWYEREGDRRVNELMRSLEAAATLRTNDAALAHLDAAAQPAPHAIIGGNGR